MSRSSSSAAPAAVPAVTGIEIDVRDVVVHVDGPDGRLPVLRGVTFHVTPGELVALVGPSGSGKTTLLNVVGGLEPGFEGSVRLDQNHAWTGSDRERAARRNRDIGFVFQTANLLPGLSAAENVYLPLLLRPGGAAPATGTLRAEASQLLERCGLSNKSDTQVERLSGGERQRVATARALIGHPRLVLVDEPTGSLDGENTRLILDLLFEYRDDRDTTMLVATHDDRVIRRADRVVTMRDGVIVDAP